MQYERSERYVRVYLQYKVRLTTYCILESGHINNAKTASQALCPLDLSRILCSIRTSFASHSLIGFLCWDEMDFYKVLAMTAWDPVRCQHETWFLHRNDYWALERLCIHVP